MQPATTVEIKVEEHVPDFEGQQIDDLFICLCCINVVYKPVECNQCQKWFCEQCIEQWRQMGHRECMQCKGNFKRSEKLHFSLRNKLHDLKFRCSKCAKKDPDGEGAQSMAYQKYCEHVSAKCPETFFRCPFNCDITG